MNKFQQAELDASDSLGAVACALVYQYADKQDVAAARLALLMLATEREAQVQGLAVNIDFVQPTGEKA